MLKSAAALALLLATAGCADQLLSDNRLRDTTAMALSQPASSVTISDRRGDGPTNTYYVAHTPKGTYNCIINGGGVLAMGITNPPDCSPIGTPVVRRAFGSAVR